MTHEESIEASRGVLAVNPENFWREVWHDAPCRGPMKRHPLAVGLRQGEYLFPLWECMACGTRFHAGLDKDRRIVVFPETKAAK